MPRSESQRADLSAAWHSLHRLWREPLETKVAHSHQLISDALSRHSRPIVAWSGGKDSTVLLHLVRQHIPDVDVIFNDPGVDFPETYSFIESTANQWNLNLHITHPKTKNAFWEAGRSHGWPIFGKAVSSNVERALRTGNIRSQLSALEKDLVHSGLRLSCRCADVLRTAPGTEQERLLGCDLKVIGLRADESRARVRLWADYGEYFYVKRHYSYREGIWKLNPIALWVEDDIWDYHRLHELPSCELYRMGHTRNGCWTCAMAIRHGQLGRLQSSHPELFEELVVHSPMAVEIMRARDFWSGRTPKQRYSKSERRAALPDLSKVMEAGWRQVRESK